MRSLSRLALLALALAGTLLVSSYHRGEQLQPEGGLKALARAEEPAPEVSRPIPPVLQRPVEPEARLPEPSVGRGDETARMPAPKPPMGKVPDTKREPMHQDADAEGELTVDASGSFVPTRGAVTWFEHFLARYAEMPLGAIRGRMLEEIKARLQPAAAAEAISLLDDYLRYRQQAAAMLRGTLTSDLHAAMERLRQLRRERFGDEVAAALFGRREARAGAAVQIRKLLQDPTLPPDTREATLRQYATLLPAASRTTEKPEAPPYLYEVEGAMRRRGAAEADVRQVRERMAGPETAARLVQADADWQRRYDAYQASRRDLEMDASLEPSERQPTLHALLTQSFTAEERLRVEQQSRSEQSWPARP